MASLASLPAAELTVAMPSTRKRAPAPVEDDHVSISIDDHISLSLADLSIVGPSEPEGHGADPLIGMVVADRYRILELLGRGGMGSVYKVEHTRIGKLLAMKLLAGALSQSPEAVRRFKREALTVSKLESPNTVQVFDYGVADGLTYLVMELVHGQNLARALRTGGPLPFSRVGRIIVQVCSSLAEAHRKGIVHRDVKPENVMLIEGEGGADVAKVLDFGLAKLREAEALNEVTCQGMIVGTPNYMAPEQIRGEVVDARADIYSVGALMYRLLTGHAPFRAETPMAVLSKHLHERPIPPAERAPHLGIPPGVSRLVMRALRKDPADRFQRIEELQALLVEEFRAAGSISVESLLDRAEMQRIAPTSTPLATRDEVDAYERKLRRMRYGFAATMAAVALAAAGAGASLLVPRAPRFTGVEIEPNDTAAEATPLPLGQAMTGQLGRRLDLTHGDRDFYAFDLPAGAPGEKVALRLRVTALPNIPMCTMLYKPGFADAIGQYCVGRPGKDLEVPAIPLEPGRYLLAVMQDMDPHGGPAPYVYESISDSYTVVAERVVEQGGS
jgi:serine/threonine-protein kinase